MPEQNNTQEIDLFELFSRISKSFNNFFNHLLRIFLIILGFFVRKFWYILALVVIGTTGSLFYFKQLASFDYESTMNVKPNIESAQILNKINNLYTFTQESNNPQLRNIFSIDSVTANKILEIKACWYIDEDRDSIPDYVDYKNEFSLLVDTTWQRMELFEIKVKTLDNSLLPKISQGIKNYINNDMFFNKRMQIKNNQLKQLIAKTQIELNELDSLQMYYMKNVDKKNATTDSKGQIVFLKESKIELLHKDVISLTREIQKHQMELELYNKPMTIIEDFIAHNKPIKSYIDYNIKFNVIIILFGVFIIFIIDQRKRISEFLNKVKEKK